MSSSANRKPSNFESLFSHIEALLEAKLDSDMSVTGLSSKYKIADEVLSVPAVQSDEKLSSELSAFQDRVVELLTKISCESLSEVAMKFDIWRLDDEEVQSAQASRGEVLALQALVDFEKFIEAQD